jgi:hypothetical protein
MQGFFRHRLGACAVHLRRRRRRWLRPRLRWALLAFTRTREVRGASRLALPLVLTAAAAVALASLGGVSYAATKAESAATAVSEALTLTSSRHVSVVSRATSGHDQYRSGYGWGAAGHNHGGTPGIGQPGTLRPPLIAKIKGAAAYVSTRFTIDEQAHLLVSVLNSKGKKLLITQNKSTIGAGIHGVQAKTINYLVLIPRTIRITLAIPKNLLVAGQHYRIRIIARASNLQHKTLVIGFTMPGV